MHDSCTAVLVLQRSCILCHNPRDSIGHVRDLTHQQQWCVRGHHRIPVLLYVRLIMTNSFFFFLHTSTLHLLDKPWSQVSSLLSPDSCLQLFSRIGVQQSHCSSIFHRVLLLTLSRFPQVNLVHKKKPPQIYRSMHSGGFELTKLTYTRLEDNLIRHRGDRLIYDSSARTNRYIAPGAARLLATRTRTIRYRIVYLRVIFYPHPPQPVSVSRRPPTETSSGTITDKADTQVQITT